MWNRAEPIKMVRKKTTAFRKRAIYIGRSIGQIDYILSKGNQSWGTHFRATSEYRSCKKVSCLWNRKCPTFINFRLFSRDYVLNKGAVHLLFFGTFTSTIWLPLLNKPRLYLKIDCSKITFRVYILYNL